MKETDPIILAEGAARNQQVKEQLERDIDNLLSSLGTSAPEPLRKLSSNLKENLNRY